MAASRISFCNPHEPRSGQSHQILWRAGLAQAVTRRRNPQRTQEGDLGSIGPELPGWGLMPQPEEVYSLPERWELYGSARSHVPVGRMLLDQAAGPLPSSTMLMRSRCLCEMLNTSGIQMS